MVSTKDTCLAVRRQAAAFQGIRFSVLIKIFLKAGDEKSESGSKQSLLCRIS
jgi:hypothetical protein